MGRVIDLKFQQPAERGVFFQPRNIYFPQLRRLCITWNTNLEEFGIDTPAPSSDPSIVYTIDSDYENTVHGWVEAQVVSHVLEEEGQTLVIRHHNLKELAITYIDGALDAGTPDFDIDSIVQTDQGIFTLVRRASPPSEDGPFVFYQGLYPINTEFGVMDEVWLCRTNRFGQAEYGDAADTLHVWPEVVGTPPWKVDD